MGDRNNSEVRFLMGNEAIGRGMIEAGCSTATAYPGTPSSEVLESVVRWKKELDHPIYTEWSVNEKVAFEVAYGASLAGGRAMCAMKMVGLNVASDPFLSAAYLGVRGGMVIVVADDPGPHSSQTEQDSRFFAWFAKVPVLDPGTPAEALEMTRRAFELSEKYQVPVLLRPCLRVCHARQNVRLSMPQAIAHVGPFEKNWTRWAAIPKFRLALHGELNEKLDTMERQEPDTSPRLIIEGNDHKYAIITSGSVSSHVRDIVSTDLRMEEISVFKVDAPFPANRSALQDIVNTYEKTLVIEETYPVLELRISDGGTVMGRVNGQVPPQGELVPDLVEDIIVKSFDKEPTKREAPEIKPRRPSLCAGCPHRPAFFTIRNVFEDAVFTGDIGCYTLGINMGAVDTCLCMGASVGMAGGFAQALQTGESKQVVATIGDSTFYHSGVPALINAVHTGSKFVLCIMDNNVTAMTGGQPTPANDWLADGSPGKAVDMEKLVKGCGVDFLEVIDPYDFETMRDCFQRAKQHTFSDGKGVSVVIARRPCVRMPNVELSGMRFVVTERCDLCMSCVRDLECPAIYYVKGEKRMAIDEDLCGGCGFCAQVCPSQAIESKGAAHG
jgi:indolepyruvate ferredoxin oxidoreductase alpha subunit